MAFTAILVTIFVALGIAALVVGHFFDKPEVYYLGVVFLLFMGFSVTLSGFREVTGQVTTGNFTDGSGNTVVDTSVAYTYENNQDSTTNAIGLLLIVVGAGSGLTFHNSRKRKQEERMRDINVV